MTIKKQILLTAMLSTGAISSSAWAIPLTFQAQFDVATGLLVTPDQNTLNFSGNYSDFMLLNLPSFNSSLGTLNSVSVSFASAFTTSMEAFADDSAELCVFIGCEMPTIQANVGVDHRLTLTGHLLNAPSTTVSLLDIQSQYCSYSVTGPTSVTCNANESPPRNGIFDTDFDLSGYSLADFTDVSNLFFAFQLESDFYGLCGIEQTVDGEECIVTRMADWYGTVNVTYDYTEGSGGGSHAVPEPGTLSLFAAGLFGIGLVRRRKSA